MSAGRRRPGDRAGRGARIESGCIPKLALIVARTLEITLQEIDEHLYHVHGLRAAESRYGGSSTATP